MKQIHHFGLRFKLTVISSLILVVCFSLLSSVLISTQKTYLHRNLDREVKSLVSLSTQPTIDVFQLYKDSGELQIDKQINYVKSLGNFVQDISIIDVDGNTLYSQNKNIPPVTKEQAGTFATIYQNDSNGLVQTVVDPVIEQNGVHRYAMVYSINSAEISRQITRQTLLFILFCTIGLLASIVASVLAINKFIILPIRVLGRDTAKISSGDYDYQIPIIGHDEISVLAQSVNDMSKVLKSDIVDLKKADEMKSEFLRIASHNLRTPLTTVEGYLDLLESEDPAIRKTAVEGIRSGARRLGGFAEDILIVSQLNSGEHVVSSTKPVELSSFVNKVMKDFVPEATMKNIRVVIDAPEQSRRSPISLPYLRIALWNILDNALKFTSTREDSKGLITVKLSESAKEALISISDNGPGIASDELPGLFTKFHRGTETEHYNFEGEGIGLYVAKMILQKHSGTIDVDSVLGHGSTFTIHLPLIPKEIKWQYDDDRIDKEV